MTRCLVVDDSAVIRKVARRVLESLRVETSEADDGEQALAACHYQMPDGILVDSTMPLMDGYAFLKALRQMPGGLEPKIIFCTSEYDVAQVARARHFGADDYILKPFHKDGLVAKLRDVGLVPPAA